MAPERGIGKTLIVASENHLPPCGNCPTSPGSQASPGKFLPLGIKLRVNRFHTMFGKNFRIALSNVRAIRWSQAVTAELQVASAHRLCFAARSAAISD